MSKQGDAGRYRQVLQWQRMSDGTDEFNVPNGEWATLQSVRACVTPMSGRELFNARQVQASSTHNIETRGGFAFLPTDRFKFQDTERVFNIDSINRVDEQRRYILIQATEPKING